MPVSERIHLVSDGLFDSSGFWRRLGLGLAILFWATRPTGTTRGRVFAGGGVLFCVWLIGSEAQGWHDHSLGRIDQARVVSAAKIDHFCYSCGDRFPFVALVTEGFGTTIPTIRAFATVGPVILSIRLAVRLPFGLAV